uniref:Mitochondrial carrier triple repeat protein 1 n=1 Tax=Caligus rogercresseyi TaxID=217165 RepID=C1BQJ8_CALRO|nr:Mitochondrial carrier triple repeat protein 1 [Caligus rogercresseyi]|eukprot:TRINITY_DN11430_c0_g1_i1.p1 TRINITY_DN11430_c0_g1~~TRINITY_DN11430_c0_g1_i1.p1  ORF type:complete len:299 (-),score=74.01 TRINITY_DN11430_c0_g1_i1:240-1136(-)
MSSGGLERRHEGNWHEYLSGWTASVINIFVTFPINKAIFRQVLHGISMREACIQLRAEGLSTLYRGVGPPLIQKSASGSIMFGTYFQIRELLNKRSFPLASSTAALCAGCIEALLTPLERVQVLLQNSKFNSQFKHTPDALVSLGRVYGFREYYRGLSGVLLRNGPSNVLFFTFRDRMQSLPLLSPSFPSSSKDKVNSSSALRKFLSDFLLGAFLGGLISTLLYPVNVTKTHMQSRLGGSFLSFQSVLGELLRERGLSGMFKGVHLNYTRSFISWGIINLSYEFVQSKLLLHFPSPVE